MAVEWEATTDLVVAGSGVAELTVVPAANAAEAVQKMTVRQPAAPPQSAERPRLAEWSECSMAVEWEATADLVVAGSGVAELTVVPAANAAEAVQKMTVRQPAAPPQSAEWSECSMTVEWEATADLVAAGSGVAGLTAAPAASAAEAAQKMIFFNGGGAQ